MQPLSKRWGAKVNSGIVIVAIALAGLGGYQMGVTRAKKTVTEEIIGTLPAQEEYLAKLTESLQEPDEFDLVCGGIFDAVRGYDRSGGLLP